MVLKHEESEEGNPSQPPMNIPKASPETEASPEKAEKAEPRSSEEIKGTAKAKGSVKIINLDEIDIRSNPPTRASPATATVIPPPPTTTSTKTEVKSFDLNKPPTDAMRVVGDFESLLGDKPYYTTVINGQRVNIFKPPHLYVQKPSLAKPIFEKSSFEVGSGSRNPRPTVVTAADRQGLTFGSNNRNNSPPIDAVPLQSRPPAVGSLFDLLGINTETSKPKDKASLTTYQLSLLNTLARSTPGGPSPNLSIPFSPPPTGGVKRPSGIVLNETPIKKPFNKEKTITHVEFQAWKLYQERMRQAAVEIAERRVYKQLWGTIVDLQKQCMEYNKKITDFGLTVFEKNDQIDNLEMLLGLATKSLKMDARELLKFRTEGKGKQDVVGTEGGKCENEEKHPHGIKFGSFTPEELDVLHGKERLAQLNHLLQKVGGGVGCSDLAVVSEGCCNRLVVSGDVRELEERNKREERSETEVRKGRKEEEGSREGRREEEGEKEEALQDGMHTTTTKSEKDPTPRE